AFFIINSRGLIEYQLLFHKKSPDI
ncbi:MAG: hypothetical protein PWQ89_585, partial [Verrucomicrobiota bacterium]|nr:hypothetical protein [Verrucomicrobiota bacterium]